jgi:hypothetical protein
VRSLWIFFQYPLLRANACLRPATEINTRIMIPRLRLAEGVRAENVRFGELGYAREARASYQDFLAARTRGNCRHRHASR